MEESNSYQLVKILLLSATMALWVKHSPRNTDDLGSVPGTGGYMVARMTT